MTAVRRWRLTDTARVPWSAGCVGPERTEDLLQGPGWRLERIVSHGHVTPEGEWYDQDQDEWVLVVSGSATLQVDGPAAPAEMSLGPGDAVLLPAHVRHRVTRTNPDRPTVWLALFTDPE